MITLAVASLATTLVATTLTAEAPRAQEPANALPSAVRGLDELLDLYVRGGEVYYRAVKSTRGKLDGYVSSLATTSVDKLSRDEQIAFWINAYNAIVLETVIDHYPIAKTNNVYPAKSPRQIPGAFEKLAHRVGGRTLTLDQIEQTVLAEFHDPRVYFALGRGAEGGGRLRSEAFVASRLEQQLSEAAAECDTRAQCLQIDRDGGKMTVSAIFSWREKDFVAAYAEKAPGVFSDRSPIERAVVAFVEPKLLPAEREFLAKNTFKMAYKPFDWTLNDLTGRGGR
jgi:Protein of unknown function, DUF547